MLGLADGGFKCADARRHYLAAYDELRALSPPPNVVHDVPTRFGTVRVYQHGPADGIPVVLIHGFFLTSAMWWEQVAGLASDFTVYTLDMLGQPGASIQSKTMFAPADCARSIDEVLEGLRLRAVHLVGHSYGGWLATHTAARAPGRLATVTLVDPASTVARTSATFWRSLALIMSRPRSVRAGRAAAWIAGHPTPGSSIDTLCPVVHGRIRGLRSTRAHTSAALPQRPSVAFSIYPGPSSSGGQHRSRFRKGNSTDAVRGAGVAISPLAHRVPRLASRDP